MKLQTLMFIVLCLLFLPIHMSSAQNCGRRRTSRIVNGGNTGVNEFTMMAGLVQGTAFVFCGATILTNYYVLSAAHCLSGKTATSVQVLCGDWDYKSSSDTPYAALYVVQSYFIHQSYNYNTGANDIAIITTQKAIVYNVAVGPVCLPPTNLLFTNSYVEAVGWGTLSHGGLIPSILQKVTLQVIPNTQCANYLPNMMDSKICTYAYQRDSCQYDSGGPLYYMLNGYVHLVGIIQGGSGCATTTPSVSTRITSFVPWIKQYAPGAFYS